MSLESKKNSGFSVIELLVVVFLFSLIALIVTGIFVRSLEIERLAFAAQKIQDNIISVFGVMNKEIRVGNVTSANDGSCTSNSLSLIVQDTSGSTYAVTYRLNTSTGIVERELVGGILYVSSDDVVFNSLLFCIAGAGLDGQPNRVTVVANVSNRYGRPVSMNVQTTISGRDITDELLN